MNEANSPPDAPPGDGPRRRGLALHWQVLIAMALGVVFATLFGANSAVDRLAELFLRLLRMVIVPLIFASIVSGVAGIADGRSLGRLGIKTLLFYTLSSFLAIVVGMTLALTIQPGVGVEVPTGTTYDAGDLETPGSLSDVLVRLIPTNPAAAAADFDILGLIFFSIVLGAVIAGMQGDAGDQLRRLADAGFQAMMRMTQLIIRLLPIGVFALIARAISQMGFEVFRQVALYMLTIAAGLTVHLFVTLPLLYLIATRRNPLLHFRAVGGAMAMAFSTSSSAATLPMTLTNVQDNAGVSRRVSSFVLPLGSTVNMDGTALYECAGALFITQALGFEMTFAQQLVVVITALLASVGAAAVPSAGLVMIFIVLEAIGLDDPAAYALVGLMLGVDRPLDMFRTVVNVTSDSFCAAIIAHSEGEKLQP